MSENEWIEKQKQRLSQNCIIQGQFGSSFPMQSSFYLKPQGHQIWA
jgi:hypothetical protein